MERHLADLLDLSWKEVVAGVAILIGLMALAYYLSM